MRNEDCSVLSPIASAIRTGRFLRPATRRLAPVARILDALHRLAQAAHGRLFARIAVPMMTPGLVTIFLFQFVAVWNNFLLPFIMLSDENKFPITVGLFTLLNRGSSAPALYSLVVTGSLLSIIPLIILFLALQRYWRTDIASGAVKQ